MFAGVSNIVMPRALGTEEADPDHVAYGTRYAMVL